MPRYRESDGESTVLSAPAAARLLERASELDAARLAEVRIRPILGEQGLVYLRGTLNVW